MVTEGVFGASVMNTKYHDLRHRETCKNSMYIYIHDSVNVMIMEIIILVEKFGLTINVDMLYLS